MSLFELLKMDRMTMTKTALVLVDIQNDFLEGGALGVTGSKSILPTAYQLLDPSYEWSAVIASQDYHPPGHVSFASAHGLEPFTQLLRGDTTLDLWPDHCIQGTRGSELEAGIQERLDRLREMGREVRVVQKGSDIKQENYSIFKKDEQQDELDEYLGSKDISQLVCLGGLFLFLFL